MLAVACAGTSLPGQELRTLHRGDFWGDKIPVLLDNGVQATVARCEIWLKPQL